MTVRMRWVVDVVVPLALLTLAVKVAYSSLYRGASAVVWLLCRPLGCRCCPSMVDAVGQLAIESLKVGGQRAGSGSCWLPLVVVNQSEKTAWATTGTAKCYQHCAAGRQ